MSRRRDAAFTLTELLATLAVAGVAMAAALPSLDRIARDSERAEAVNDLAGALQLARSVAITRNVRVVVCASPTGRDCQGSAWERGWLVFLDGDGDLQPDAGESALASGNELPGMTVRSDQFAGAITFRPTGQLDTDTPTGTGQFTFCDGRGDAAARVLAVSVAGQARLRERSLDGSAPACPRDDSA
jgi:type IV fimbrial biogenesis protein FimT